MWTPHRQEIFTAICTAGFYRSTFGLYYFVLMIVTVTSLRLRRLWDFFRLSYWGMQIVKQTRSQKGFVKMKNTGFGYMHYTLSVWNSESDLKNFAMSGAHLRAMKQGASIAAEVRTYTHHTDQMPTWKEVKSVLATKGKVIVY